MKNIENLVSTQILKKVQTSDDCKGSGNEIPTYVEQEEYVRVPARIFERIMNYIEPDNYWDVGLLGNSEEHTKPSSMTITLKDKIRQEALDRRSQDPWRWATHCLKASPLALYMQIGKDWYLFTEDKWQPTEVWFAILTPIEHELHEDVWISRESIKKIEDEYLKNGSEELVARYVDLSNTNSLSILVAMRVVFKRYNIKIS